MTKLTVKPELTHGDIVQARVAFSQLRNNLILYWSECLSDKTYWAKRIQEVNDAEHHIWMATHKLVYSYNEGGGARD